MNREEAIEVLKRAVAYTSEFADAKQLAIEALKAQDSMIPPKLKGKTADIIVIDGAADRPKGKWINVNVHNVGDCSECGTAGHAWNNFCPICGADMRGDDE